MEGSHVLQTIARKKWAILAAALGCALLSAAAAWRAGASYTASVTLKIRPRDFLAPVDQILTPRPDEGGEPMTLEAQQAQTQALVKTVEAMVRSPAVLDPAIRRLHLPTSAAQLQSRIEVKEASPVLVRISVSANTPKSARDLAGALTDSFSRFAADLRGAEARRDVEAAQRQADAARQELDRVVPLMGVSGTLRRNAAEQNYAGLVRRVAQLRDAEALLRQGAMVTVVDPPGITPSPGDDRAGRTLKLAVAALLLGALAAAAVAVALEAFDRRIRTLADAEALFDRPVLAVVPHAPAGWDARLVATAAGEHPTSPVAEAIHFLALRVIRRAPSEGCLVLAGLAARPGQGATVTLTNLAISLAQTGRRVALVDADLRRPSIHEFFGLPNSRGLSQVASAPGSPDQLAIPTPIANLVLVPAGPEVSNPWQVLRSEATEAFLGALRERAEIVVLNTAPATESADALTVAGYADASLAVFRASEVPGGPEIALRDLSREAGVELIGVVLNDVRAAEIRALRLQMRPAQLGSEQVPRALLAASN
jgi:Mrp family chromosome partitioning ATPase